MKQFLDFLPLLLFFAVYYLHGIYAATVAVIIGSVAVVGWGYLRYRRIEKVPLITMVVVVIMGGLTLYLRDPIFIKWKPTLVYGVFAAALLATQYCTAKSAVERLLEGKLPLPRMTLRRINFAWAVFFIFCGVLNVYVAFYYGADLDEETRTDFWVNFKVFGFTGLSILFMLLHIPFVAKHLHAVQNGRTGS